LIDAQPEDLKWAHGLIEASGPGLTLTDCAGGFLPGVSLGCLRIQDQEDHI